MYIPPRANQGGQDFIRGGGPPPLAPRWLRPCIELLHLLHVISSPLIAVALASKRLDIMALVISKFTIQPNIFHRLTPYKLSNGSESVASGEKGPLQMIILEMMRSGTYWHIDFARRLPALHALNICTKPSGSHKRATVPVCPTMCLSSIRKKLRNSKKHF